MATNVFRKLPGFRNEQWEVPAGTLAGAVVINNVDGRPGLALTSIAGANSVQTLGGTTITTTGGAGGIGNAPGAAVVGVEGYDALLTVTGVTAGETVGTGATGTPQGTAVYAVVAAGAVTSLTLTSSGNTKIGVIADGNIIGTSAPVSIGVDL